MTLIDQVFRSPQLPQILRELNQLCDKEQAARKEFYETITEKDKAELLMDSLFSFSCKVQV
jgi:HD-like signal output (HDOD) protein